MPAIEINAASAVCRKCGRSYGRLKGYFPVNYGYLYKGAGYLPYCKECIDDMYTTYLDHCKDEKQATRQMCRKLDLYWSDQLFEQSIKTATARTVMTGYLVKLSVAKYAGKSYDDTLEEEGTLWPGESQAAIEQGDDVDELRYEPSDEVIAFWGPGYEPEDYFELEQRKNYWLDHLPSGVDVTVGLEALLRQICSLEIDINRARASGSSVDKLQTTLNTLLGSAMLKPAQGNENTDATLEKTPFGVWIRRWENERPVPEPDPELQDADGIVRYITIWFLGHLCKMLGIKNSYCKLYEEELKKYQVERHEYEEDNDETLFNDIFSVTQGEQ